MRLTDNDKLGILRGALDLLWNEEPPWGRDTESACVWSIAQANMAWVSVHGLPHCPP